MSAPASPLLSPSQLAALAEIGEERSAPVGELLYRVGDEIYPFVAILEGEVAIVDAAGNELVRHGPSGFLGELNLLSGQTVFVNALVAEPLRYIAVERAALRSLLNEDGPLSDLLLSTFISRREALQSVQGIGLEIVGPHGSDPTMQMLEFARANRLPYTWQDGNPPDGGEVPLVRLPGGGELHRPTRGQVMRTLGIGLELAPTEAVDLLIVGAGPAGLAAAVYGASEGLDTLVVESTALGGQAGLVATDRELPRLSRRDQRHRAHQPRGHPSAQVQRTHRDARTARSPWSQETAATSSGSRTTARSLRAPCCSQRALSTDAYPSIAWPSSKE